MLGDKHFSEGDILRSVPLLALGLTPQVQRIDAQILPADACGTAGASITIHPVSFDTSAAELATHDVKSLSAFSYGR